MHARAHCFLAGLAWLTASIQAQAADPESGVLPAPTPTAAPTTTPESTAHERTSTFAEVTTFVDALRLRAPHADRLRPFVFGRSVEGRALYAVEVGPVDRQAPAALTVLVVANIHGGEVEGKEACQALLREFAYGAHGELLEHLRLLVVPVFNVDGNETISRTNRVAQNGPAGGVGQRPNADGLDLNRDFIKLESPEARGLVDLMVRFDPDLLLDLHTTNGTYHGYHLTYASSLSTNVDPGVDRFGRDTILAGARERMAAEGFRSFDYGILSRGEPERWVTFDHRPRFLTNYFGLRNRISVLSEAYSYKDFATRIAATRSFVLAVLRTAADHRADLRAVVDAADRACRRSPADFGMETRPGDPERLEILLGQVEKVVLEDDLGTRLVADDSYRSVPVGVVRRFTSTVQLPAPGFGWAIVDPSSAVITNLQAHGIEHIRLTSARDRLALRAFQVSGRSRNPRVFQGHRAVKVDGAWQDAERALPVGTVIVPARQRLGRLAAQLLEPQSEDGLTTWNAFDDAADDRWPVLRLADDPRR